MLDFVGASTEEVYWLPATQYEHNRRTSTQTLCKTIVVAAQQKNKGKSNNNQTKLCIHDKTTIYNTRERSHYYHWQGVAASNFGC
jgi:hypothetical protein